MYVGVWQDDKPSWDRVFVQLVVLDKQGIDTLLSGDQTVNDLFLHPENLHIADSGIFLSLEYLADVLQCTGEGPHLFLVISGVLNRRDLDLLENLPGCCDNCADSRRCGRGERIRRSEHEGWLWRQCSD